MTHPRAVALALALACALAHPARANDASAPVLTRLAKTADQRHHDSVLERTHTLERLLRALPDVSEATAALTLPDIHRTPLDHPLAPPRVALVLRLEGHGPDDATLLRLARSVVRDLSPGDLTVSRHSGGTVAPRADAARTEIGVNAKSSTLLRAILALSLTGNVLLASLMLWRARRNRPRRPFVDRGGRGGPHA